MKKLLILILLAAASRSYGQKDDTLKLPTLGGNYPLQLGGTISNNIFKGIEGKMVDKYDTIKCKYILIDTSQQNNIFNGGSKVYYVNGYKVLHRKGKQTYWEDNSCPDHYPDCCVNHIAWREEPIPIISTHYLLANKNKVSKTFIVHELN